jgi:hypothetical protein
MIFEETASSKSTVEVRCSLDGHAGFQSVGDEGAMVGRFLAEQLQAIEDSGFLR